MVWANSLRPNIDPIKGLPDSAEHRLGHCGKPDSAMGGGSDLLKLDDALAALDDFMAESWPTKRTS